MGFFSGIARGFGCMGSGCGWIVGVLLFLALAGVVCGAITSH